MTINSKINSASADIFSNLVCLIYLRISRVTSKNKKITDNLYKILS